MTLIGPPIIAMPEYSALLAGSGSPQSIAIKRHGTRLASRNVAKWPGSSVRAWRMIATGFNGGIRWSAWRHFTVAGALAMAMSGALAADVTLIGTSASRAVFRINGVTKIIRPGQ
ncbi:MAG TPA: hypothetical protein VIS73_11610, partial [Rhodocyclaceae bacterium]